LTVRVQIPPVLRNAAGGRRAVAAEGATLQDVLLDLARQYPSLALHLFDEQGAVRRHILCLHASDAIRPRDFAARALKHGDEVVITNALAGG